MAEPKPFASLSSGLLARKGAAKPAMRPQGFGQVPMGIGIEDLGWNDMGHSAPVPVFQDVEPIEHVPSSIAALTPAPRTGQSEPAPIEVAEEPAPPPPPVVEQQRVIEATFAEPAKPAPRVAPRVAAVVPLPPRERRAPGAKAKAAFTLRLDAERHLKLRLACAVTHRSAQQLVTEALDQFLAAQPELEAISTTVTAKAGKNN